MIVRCRFYVLLLSSLFAALGNASASGTETPVSKAIPFKPASSSATGDPYQLIIGFVVCMLVLAVVIYVLRRRLASSLTIGGVKKQLRVTETQRLGARSTLHVVEFAGTRYLLAQTEQHVSCIASAPVDVVSERAQ
jgi:flagellar biogenesis protein FliO